MDLANGIDIAIVQGSDKVDTGRRKGAEISRETDTVSGPTEEIGANNNELRKTSQIQSPKDPPIITPDT